MLSADPAVVQRPGLVPCPDHNPAGLVAKPLQHVWHRPSAASARPGTTTVGRGASDPQSYRQAEGARVQVRLRSGDSPLSVRGCPSTVKGASRFLRKWPPATLERRSLCTPSGQKPRARTSLPGPDAGHPLQGAGISHEEENVVQLACN